MEKSSASTMAQEHLRLPGPEADDALALASQIVASLRAEDMEATTSSLAFPFHSGPLNSFKQPTMSSMPPSPFPNPTTQTTNAAHHNGKETAQPSGATFQIPHPSEQSGDHGDPDVDPTRENAQQVAEMPREAEPVGVGAAIAEENVLSDKLSDVDMSDEPQSLTSPESEDDIDRLDKFAFSYAGQAYDHRVPQHLTGGTTLFAKKVTQGVTILERIRSANNQDESSMCPDLVPHELEMKHTARAVECIWVGVLPNPQSNSKHAASISADQDAQADAASPAAQNAGDNATAEAQIDGTSTTAKTVRKRAKKALSIIDLEDDQLDITPYNPNAFRVVAKKQNKKVKTWHLYALTTSDDDSKLCHGWKVHSDEVFFFKAFRDDTVAGLLKRRHASDDKIKAVTFPADEPSLSAPKSPPSENRLASLVSAPATPTPGGLPSPKPSGRKGKPSRTVRKATGKQACKVGDKLDQDDDDAVSLAGNVEHGDDPDAGEHSGHEPKETGTARLEADQSELTGTVYDDGDEDAYPEHAVPANSSSYKNLVDYMVRELSVVDPASEKQGEKRKRVAFEPGCPDAPSLRRKTDDSPRSITDTRGGLGREVSASYVVQQHTDHLVKKLTSMIDTLEAKQDVAGLRQCVTMVESIEKRSCPGPTSVLAPYLSITSKKDATPRACCGKLREILDLFPNLEDVDVDNHVLTCMISGLRLTGQSIDIGLIEPCVKSFSRLYKQNFGETANHPTAVSKHVLTDMICQARDDAEKMVKKIPLHSESKVWVPHLWIDPRDDAENVDVDYR